MVAAKWLQNSIFIALVSPSIALLLFAIHLPQPKSDWHLSFYPATLAWLQGSSPYAVPQFFNPPWTVMFLAPFTLQGEDWGRALLGLGTLAVVALAAATWSDTKQVRLLSLLLILTSPLTLRLAFIGQLDALPLLGLILSEGGYLPTLSTLLVLVKPQVYITGLILNRIFLKNLPWIAIALFLASLPFGLDWPIQLLRSYQAEPPYRDFTVSTWRLATEVLNLPWWLVVLYATSLLFIVFRYYLAYKDSKDKMVVLLVGTALLTPYSSVATTTVLLSLTLPRLLSANLYLGLATYALSLTPILLVPFSTPAEVWLHLALWGWLLLALVIAKELKSDSYTLDKGWGKCGEVGSPSISSY